MRSFRILLFCMFAMLCALPAAAQNRLFRDVAKIKGVTSIYISKAALKMGAATSNSFNVHDKDYSKSLKRLDGIEIIQCDKKSIISDVQKACHDILDGSQRDLLMEIIDDTERVSLYARIGDDGRMADDMILEVDENDEYTVIYFKGEIDVEGVISTIQSD